MRADHVSNCVRVERIPAHCDAIARLNCAAYSNRLHSACDRRSFVPAVSRAIIESNADCHAHARCDSLHFRPVPTYGAPCIAISKGIRRIWNYFKTYLRTSRYWKIIGICDERLSSWTCQSDGRLSCLTLYHVIWYIRILCIYLYTFYILYSFYFLSLRLDCYIDFLIYRFIADEQFYNNC